MRKWIKSSLGISGPKAAVEVVAEVAEAEVEEVVVEEEEVSGRRPALNLIPRILASTSIRGLGSSSLRNRWSFPERPGRRTHQRKGKLAYSPR